MKIFVTGGTGFVGSRLIPHLVERGHDVVLLARREERVPPIVERTSIVVGDPTQPGPWQEAVADCDAAVNLAGTPIVGRWTAERKLLIRESRIRTTRNLVDAIPAGKPFTLFSTSAVGIYGDAGDRELDETAPPGKDYLARVATEWEEAARSAEGKGVRVIIGRFAIVFGIEGGALAELVKNAKTLRGGPVGGGRQWMSWIHRDDLVRAISTLLETPDARGVYNLGSPNPIRQGDLAKIIGKILGTPASIPAPAFAVRLFLGEMADVVLFSQRMSPKRIVAMGFDYLHPEAEESLRTLLKDF